MSMLDVFSCWEDHLLFWLYKMMVLGLMLNSWWNFNFVGLWFRRWTELSLSSVGFGGRCWSGVVGLIGFLEIVLMLLVILLDLLLFDLLDELMIKIVHNLLLI